MAFVYKESMSENGKAAVMAAQAGSENGDDTGHATPVVIIGAGPAGLTGAYELSKKNVKAVVLEASRMVGGLARTETYRGYHFDIGGHRFFTKVTLVQNMWREILGDDFISRPQAIADLLQLKVLQLSFRTHECSVWAGSARGATLRIELRLGESISAAAGGKLRSVGLESFREKAVRNLFQSIHRKGVGHPMPGTERGMGCTKNSGIVAYVRGY
jgi:monoamine oxidase